ncbi:MAG: CHAP domain-containing protein [Acetatifactor sp.]|nr:CHAP domain-containing protein [Acetatifactor sp.]
MEGIKNALERAAGLYEKTEKGICGYTEEKMRTSKTGLSLFSGLANLFGKIAEGLFSSVTTAWNKILWPGIEGVIKGLIGKGEVSDRQPIVSWAGEVHKNLMAAVKSAAEKVAAEREAAEKEAAEKEVADSRAAAVADLKVREGTILADITGEFYCSNKNISYAGGYHGQCTWYAYGRFMEVTGIALKTAGHARTWLSNNANDDRVKITYGGEDIQWPAIAVSESGEHGHVMFIEGVEYNADGTPANVYLTEANYAGREDGVLQCLTYDDFKSRGISGYITAA